MNVQTLKPVTKPSKQRKMLRQAPAHVRYKLFGASLSPELQASQGIGTLPVRSGDTVRVLRGDNKGFEGKITRVDRAHYRIYVEGLTREKVDGTAIPVSVHPSKVMITSLNLDDKWRKKILERKRELRKELERVPEKPPKKVVGVKEKIAEEKIPEKVVAEEEKPKEKKPRAKKRAARKPKVEKAEEETEEAEAEEKPKAKAEEKQKTKKPRAKRKTASKKAEEEGGA
jgi:large subunit ribosomal protein L24